MKPQVVPPHYVLQGESLDYLGDVLFQRRMLGKLRSRVMPDTTHILASQYFGKLAPHHGLLPTDVTRKRMQGKRSAAAYAK